MCACRACAFKCLGQKQGKTADIKSGCCLSVTGDSLRYVLDAICTGCDMFWMTSNLWRLNFPRASASSFCSVNFPCFVFSSFSVYYSFSCSVFFFQPVISSLRCFVTLHALLIAVLLDKHSAVLVEMTSKMFHFSRFLVVITPPNMSPFFDVCFNKCSQLVQR